MRHSFVLSLSVLLSAAPGALGAQSYTPPPSNAQAGVSIDRFIGDANRSPSRVSHDVLLTRSILRAGDPHQPGDPGAVLRHNEEIVLATLPALNSTPLHRTSDQLILVVQSGEGRLDDGSLGWDLRPGIAVLIPPNVPHRFTAAGEPLQMIMLVREQDPEAAPPPGMLVRDIHALAFTERNSHWANMAKYVFSGWHEGDGLHWGDRVLFVYMGPMTIARPHPHTPETEEVWIKMTDGNTYMQLGDEVRAWPKNAAFMVPPNDQTVHAALNLDDDIQGWLYYARHPGVGRFDPSAPRNPAIDEALQRATIPGTPLQGSGTR